MRQFLYRVWHLQHEYLPGTYSTVVFYTEESDGDYENGDPTTSLGAAASVECAVEDAISTIRKELNVLDTIDFDSMIDVEETQDISYMIDADFLQEKCLMPETRWIFK